MQNTPSMPATMAPIPGDTANLLTVAAYLADEHGIAAPTLMQIVEFSIASAAQVVAIARLTKAGHVTPAQVAARIAGQS